MLRSHKIRLSPNNKQATYFEKASGISRFAYNWTLAESRKLYEAGEKTSEYSMHKLLVSKKKSEFPWMLEVTKWAAQDGVIRAFVALKRWWSKHSEAPKFKSKHKSKKSFYVGVNHFKAEGFQLQVPNLGKVRMTQEIRFKGKQKSVVISKHGKNWFASFLIEVDESYKYPNICENQAVVGVDLGLNTLITLSTGKKFENQKLLYRKERRLRLLQKGLSRKKKGSKNFQKAKLLLAEAFRKLSDARKDYQHKVTSFIVKNFKLIGIEDLSVSNMMKNHCLAKSLSDASFYEIRRQLEYKAKLGSSEVIVADRWHASSKFCSVCDEKNTELKLQDRVWTCNCCGTQHDRDVNAAVNLSKYALSHRVKACGEDVSLGFGSLDLSSLVEPGNQHSLSLLNTGSGV